MAFRELEPSTPDASLRSRVVSRAARHRSAPRNGLATQTPITYRSSNEHDGGLRVGNEKQGTARFDLNLRAEQEDGNRRFYALVDYFRTCHSIRE